jgi:hypothetical protein
MVSKEMLLVRVQGKGTGRVLWVQAHPAQRHNIRYWRNQNLAGVLEADEPTIEQMIGGRGKQQAVRTVETLLVGGLAPGLDVASNQVGYIRG